MKLKLTWKIWLLIIVIFFSLISIFGIPPAFFQKGVLITSVETNSTAFEQGLRKGVVLLEVDGEKINQLEDFTNLMQKKFPSNESLKTIFTTKDSEFILFSNKAPEITVSNIPKTNIKTGLDLSGGSRVLVKAEGKTLSSNEVNDLVAVTKERLNVYGLSDINIQSVSDLGGEHYMLVEIAGATPTDLKELISKQGKFEAKIGDEVVFTGGEKDITSVIRSGQESGISSCDNSQQGYFCTFRFGIYLSEEAAKTHADITDKLGINETNPEYLSKPLDLYLDDNLMDSLLISKSLKGRVTTQVQVSGSGKGESKEDAYKDAENSMKKLQTILITGSLPYKLEIVKLDTISPTLGKEFNSFLLLAGFAALAVVALVIVVRYRNFKSSLALLLTSTSEIVIILGIASFIDWNLDLPSIAGILATIGTGIDSQIIILDESKQNISLSIKQRLKRAFAIIFGSYFTVLVSLLPLIWAGAGLLKGFAITTLIGITAGVLITRPAFADIIRKMGE